VKVGDLVVDDGRSIEMPRYNDYGIIYGVVTCLPYALNTWSDTQIMVCEVLWSGDDEPARVEMKAIEKGWIKIISDP